MYRIALALGGMTVSELSRRMTFYELRGWELFEETFGPLHLAIRFEHAVARAVQPFLKDATVEKLMIWPKKQEEPASLEGVFGLLKASGKKKS